MDVNLLAVAVAAMVETAELLLVQI